jgi:hypothetical protein
MLILESSFALRYGVAASPAVTTDPRRRQQPTLRSPRPNQIAGTSRKRTVSLSTSKVIGF